MAAQIYLVNMPYSSLTHPSLALGLIENYIAQYHHQSEVIYGNLAFAKQIGFAEYDAIDNSFFEQLIGEWTFSRAAFPEKTQDDNAFFALFSDITEALKANLIDVRQQAELYIEQLAQSIAVNQPKIIACTSTFQQNCASLALLRRVKQLSPATVTMMGGANCEGIMGQTISEQFTWVDYVFSGECDKVIGQFVNRIMNGEKISSHNLPYGFISQQLNAQVIAVEQDKTTIPRGFIDDMRDVGTPTYDSYFAALKQMELTEVIDAGLLAETSRGCWWGAKKHCTFCGLNGASLDHRSKTADRVIEEFTELANKYDNSNFEIVDNILPMEYMDTVLPALSEGSEFNIFYETKSNLRKSHVKKLADAGVRWIQPGFESLHDDFLKLIDKGVTGIQNISALKWSRQYGIHVIWNLLCGAPHEKEQWYFDMAEILPLLAHIQPPYEKLIKIRYPRFSPYFKKPEKYGLTLEPLKSYQHVYPLTGKNLFNIAYFFDQQTPLSQHVFNLYSKNNQFEWQGHNALQQELNRWLACWKNNNIPLLYMSDQGENLLIIDTRAVATQTTHLLSGLAADIYRLCEEPITAARIKAKLLERGIESDAEQITKVLTELVNSKVMLHLSRCYLSLALTGKTQPMPNVAAKPTGSLKIPAKA